MIDISTSQGTIDWSEVKAAGIMGVIIKASEGSSHSSSREEYFAANAAQARANGILIGAYHFFRANEDATTQAAVFRQVLEAAGVPMDLSPTLDVETNDGEAADDVSIAAFDCLNQMESDFGRKPILYTYADFANNYLEPELLSTFPLWIASYGDDALTSPGVPPYQPVMPDGWSSYALFQYSDRGRVSGIGTDVDLDLFWGSREELQALGLPVPYPGYVLCYQGSQNREEDVKRVQKRLGVQETGVYGMTTACTVFTFQGRNGIGQTGEVGSETWGALFG